MHGTALISGPKRHQAKLRKLCCGYFGEAKHGSDSCELSSRSTDGFSDVRRVDGSHVPNGIGQSSVRRSQMVGGRSASLWLPACCCAGSRRRHQGILRVTGFGTNAYWSAGVCCNSRRSGGHIPASKTVVLCFLGLPIGRVQRGAGLSGVVRTKPLLRPRRQRRRSGRPRGLGVPHRAQWCKGGGGPVDGAWPSALHLPRRSLDRYRSWPAAR
jgi:hypothetical protein